MTDFLVSLTKLGRKRTVLGLVVVGALLFGLSIFSRPVGASGHDPLKIEVATATTVIAPVPMFGSYPAKREWFQIQVSPNNTGQFTYINTNGLVLSSDKLQTTAYTTEAVNGRLTTVGRAVFVARYNGQPVNINVRVIGPKIESKNIPHREASFEIRTRRGNTLLLQRSTANGIIDDRAVLIVR